MSHVCLYTLYLPYILEIYCSYIKDTSGLVNVAHQLGGSLGLGILVTVFTAAGSAAMAPAQLLATRVAASLTAGTVMLGLAFVIFMVWIVRPGIV
jgi:hypothetical protein